MRSVWQERVWIAVWTVFFVSLVIAWMR